MSQDDEQDTAYWYDTTEVTSLQEIQQANEVKGRSNFEVMLGCHDQSVARYSNFAIVVMLKQEQAEHKNSKRKT
jgi:hypothetical protein